MIRRTAAIKAAPLLLLSLCFFFHTDIAAQQTAADASPVFVRDAGGREQQLPFEAGRTDLVVDRPAPRDRKGYIELPGERSAFVVTDRQPRFVVGFRNAPDGRPPFLVRLGERRGARRFTALVERGRTGFARLRREVVEVEYRTLAAAGNIVRLEAVPRVPLAAGEYAFVDTDSKRIATFRIIE